MNSRCDSEAGASDEGAVAAATSTASAPAVSDKNVAVLSFENLSEEKANAYFADGVQDEILTDLAKMADLKVISRTSVMQSQERRVAQPARDRPAAQAIERTATGQAFTVDLTKAVSVTAMPALGGGRSAFSC